MHKLLVELGTEDLPPKSLAALGRAFADDVDAEQLAVVGVEDELEHSGRVADNLAFSFNNFFLELDDRELIETIHVRNTSHEFL